MEPRDDDIQFDFFEDEPPTTEAQAGSRVRLPRRGGTGSGGSRGAGGPPSGLTPALRLLALLAIVVAALVFFGLLIQSCAATSKKDSYANYMADVTTIARGSQQDGTAVANALITPSAKPAALSDKLRAIAEQERQNVRKAQGLDAPGPLRDENQQLVEALQLRVSGVQGLADTFTANPTSKATGEAALLAEQADRLLASDVVWDDLFLAPATKQMDDEGVTGVSAPDSNFVANRDLTTERSMSLLLTRLRGATTGGKPTGLHGTNLVSVKTLPADQTLSPTDENTVTGSPDLAFVVAIEDSGESQEVGIKVTLTIAKPQGAIVKTKTIGLINPGQTKSVTFTDIGSVPFAQKTTVNVDVAAVPGEQRTNNNKASYPVIFSLG
jgi:hypothetical protein